MPVLRALGKADVYSDSFINQTIETWQSLGNRSVTRRDAEEIIANVAGVLHLLQFWSEGEVSSEASSSERSRNQGSSPSFSNGEPQ